MHQASVGFHCPECTRSGSTTVYHGIPTEVPWLTYVLIGLNVAVFLIGVALDGQGALRGGADRMTLDYGLFARLTYNGYVSNFGVGAGEWYRIITSGFLHAGFIHLAMNMYVLYLLGRLVEPAGRMRMALIYVAALVAGSLGALLLTPGNPTVGASGAIFGLMGALFMGHRSMGIDWRNSPVLNVIVLNLVFTFLFARMISVGGHVGGLVGGGIAGWLAFDLARKPTVPNWVAPALTVVFTIACGVGAVVFAESWLP